ncbi:hypothetical protein DZD52_18890 [Xanthomonas nasturtii]|uniref:Uncharacterized protein n=1 Tax=Xanthomonas nasturtii TaxID=1843581 RepID=A0A3E1KES1_9XANT|nr:hypothetical protein DZD52_18890 [Xanthomonas nasturtii]
MDQSICAKRPNPLPGQAAGSSRDTRLPPATTLRNLALTPSHAQFMLQCAKFVTPPSQSGLSVLICC